MDTDSSIKVQIALTFLPKVNTRAFLPLIEQCGGIEGFFCESDKSLHVLCQEMNVNHRLLDRKGALQAAEGELRSVNKLGIQTCSFEHHNYPALLGLCEDAPLVFYFKGSLVSQDKIYLSIVGTRKASMHCKERVNSILEELDSLGHHPVIVSGLAYGIDITAHTASLRYDFPTYAVLGHGLHTVYPASHKSTAEKIIVCGGALISEFPCSAPILPVNFLQRNRIVAGLSHATFVAESAIKGGSMTTARLASSYNRDVMALPGRPEDKMSAGCNLLIKQNIAALVENGTDLCRVLNLDCTPKQGQQTTLKFFEPDEQEVLILRLLTEAGSMNIDELIIGTGIPASELSAILLKLELEGILISLPGKSYILN